MAYYDKDLQFGSIWPDIRKALAYMTVKDKELASSLDTSEYQHNFALYDAALNHMGDATLYGEYYTIKFLQNLFPTMELSIMKEWIINPFMIPQRFRGEIVTAVEPLVISNFVEKNEYYRTYMGLAPMDIKFDEYVFLQTETYIKLGIPQDQYGDEFRYPAIHEMDHLTLVQVNMTTDYQNLIKDNPTKLYLQYTGNNSITLKSMRLAEDYEIMRLFPNTSIDVNERLLETFASNYSKVRSYFINHLYNSYFINTTQQYRELIGMCIIIKALRLTMNNQLDGIITCDYYFNEFIEWLFRIYRLPTILQKIPMNMRRNIAINMGKLIRDKATNKVLYDIADLLGFDSVIISKLILVKQQKYDADGNTIRQYYEEPEHGRPNLNYVGYVSYGDPSLPPYDITLNVGDLWYETEKITPPQFDSTTPGPSSFNAMQWAIEPDGSTHWNSVLWDPQESEAWYNLNVTIGKSSCWYHEERPNYPGIWKMVKWVEDWYHDYVRYFEEIDIKDPNPFYTMKRKLNIRNYDEVVNSDPRWWEDTTIYGPPESPFDAFLHNEFDEVKHIVFSRMYNYVDTKYLMITINYSMTKMMFDSMYLMRMLLDTKEHTEKLLVKLPNYGGNDIHSLYDVILFIVSGICQIQYNQKDGVIGWADNDRAGEIIDNDGPSSIINNWGMQDDGPGRTTPVTKESYTTNIRSILMYNFDIPMSKVLEYIENCKYINKEVTLSYIVSTPMNTFKEVTMMYVYGIMALKSYLNTQIDLADNIDVWREYSGLFHILFTGDPIRDVHAKPTDVKSVYDTDYYITPPIRYKLYDAEMSPGGTTSLSIGTAIVISIPQQLAGIDRIVDITIGRVEEVDNNGVPTKINFVYPSSSDDRFALKMFNNPLYNEDNINLEFDNNPEGTYIANGTDIGITIAVTKWHTADIYERYMAELAVRNPILNEYCSQGNIGILQNALSEACDVCAEKLDLDFRYILSQVWGNDVIVTSLIAMIKYLKSYTIDFLTSAHNIVFDYKENGNVLRIFDDTAHGGIVNKCQATDVTHYWDDLNRITNRMSINDNKTNTITPSEDVHIPLNPHISDSITIFDNVNRPDIRYTWFLYDVWISNIYLPDGYSRGTLLNDIIDIADHEGNIVYSVPIDIYLGFDPDESSPDILYHNIGVEYKEYETNTLIPIKVSIYHNQLPIVLEGIEDIVGSMNTMSRYGYCSGIPNVDYRRQDLLNPQHKILN
jgi:hypothetical protein